MAAKQKKNKKTIERMARFRDFISSTKEGMDKLEQERNKIQRALNREKYGDEKKGRSQIVMSDVFDIKEWVKSALIPIFLGGQEVLTLRPQGPEDEAAANLLEQKINSDHEHNGGFIAIHDFIDSALDSKVGWIKEWWEEDEYHDDFEYEHISMAELMALQSDADVVVISIDGADASEFMPPMFDPLSPDMEFTVKGYRVEDRSGVRFECVPPEEMIFDVYARKLRECVHKRRIKKGEAKKYGITKADMDAEDEKFKSDTDYQNRFKDLGGYGFFAPDKKKDDVWIYEYFFDEYDDDGNVNPMMMTIIGDIAVKEEDNKYEEPPFSGGSSIRKAYRIIGQSHLELATDIQELHTAVVRSIMDNLYMQNAGKRIVDAAKIDIKTLLSADRVGGTILARAGHGVDGGYRDLSPTPLPPQVYDMLDYMRKIKENRTGVMGVSPNPVPPPAMRTSGGISQILSNIQQRIALMARILAETAIKDHFTKLVRYNIKFMDKPVNIRLNEEWVRINPSDISGRFDVIIDVGAGTGTKEYQFNQMGMMLDKYANLGAVNPAAAQMLIQPDNVYNIIRTMWELLGRRNADSYITDPKKVQIGGMDAGTIAGGIGDVAGTDGTGQPGPAVTGEPAIQGIPGDAGGYPPFPIIGDSR